MSQLEVWVAAVGLVVAAATVRADEPDPFAKQRAKWDAEQVREAGKVRKKSQEKIHSTRAEERVEAAAQLGRFDDPQTLALLTAALDDADPRVRENAARSLWNLHETSGSAKDALRKRLDDIPSIAVEAAGALEAMGVPSAEVRPARRRALERGDPWTRYLAARALVGQVPAGDVFPALMDQFYADSNTRGLAPDEEYAADKRREATVESLKALVAKQDRSLIPSLVGALGRMTPDRETFIGLLARYHPPPDDWTAILVSALTVPDRDVQDAALVQLRGLTQEVEVREWVPAVGRLVKRRGGVSASAANALGHAGALAAETAPDLAALLGSGSEEERKAAAVALGRIGDRTQAAPRAVREGVARVALPALQDALREDVVRDVRLEAALAINQLQIDPAVAATALAEAATRPEEDKTARQTLLLRIGNRGGEAKAAEPLLAAFLPRAGDQRDLVESALEKIRSGRVHAPTLDVKRSLEDPDAEARAHSYLRARGIAFEREYYSKALHEADLQVVAAFLDAGMSPNEMTDPGRTALATVVEGCRHDERPTRENIRETVELLLASGADVNASGVTRMPALNFAVGSDCDRVVIRTLLKAGARLTDRDANGFDAYEAGLYFAHDGLDELLAAGYRMPPARAKELLMAYQDNPRAVAAIRKAMAPAARPAAARPAAARTGVTAKATATP
jgi:HEAT repeat protein